jgi:transposase
MEAASPLKQVVTQSEVARRLGVHRQSVIRWARQLAQSGVAGLKKAGRAGRKPRLGVTELRAIERGLKRGPEALGYTTGLWTAGRVRELIEYATGVRYHEAHVGASCASLTVAASGPPERRWSATSRRSGAGRSTAGHRLKKALCLRRTIIFVDESGLSERPHRVRTWAPRGQTPVLQYHFQLERALGRGGDHLVELLLSPLSHDHSRAAGGRFSRSSLAPPFGQAAGGLGRAAGTSGPRGQRLYRRAAGTACIPMAAELSPRSSIRWSTSGAIGKARAAQLPSARLRPTQSSGAPGAVPHAPPSATAAHLLATSPTAPVAILCRTQQSRTRRWRPPYLARSSGLSSRR